MTFLNKKAKVAAILACLLISTVGCVDRVSAIPTTALTQKESISSFCIDQTPKWVTAHQPDLEHTPLKALDVNFQCLLIDRQFNWLEKATYVHVTLKPLTQAGIEGTSTITIDFDPPYQTVIVHSIQIYRNGEWLDRLHCSRHELTQGQDSSETSSYTGTLSLVYFLSDIRVGDIIDYSFTILGETPILNSLYTNLLSLQPPHPSARISYSLLLPHDFSLSVKPFNTDLLPVIEEMSPSVKKWTWVVENQDGLSMEVDTPSWYKPSMYIACTQYSSWEELSQHISDLYILPEEWISDEMATLVEEWQTSTSDIKEKVLLACRFVQDEIRYLSFTNEDQGLRPERPDLVLKNRFGDCKGKSLLLHALLRLMKIESRPLLVHSSKGKIIPEHLPSPLLFNHCIVQIKIGNSTYWVDPTSTLQGGSLETNFYPDFTSGLLLFKDSDALVYIPPFQASRPCELQTSILFTSKETALIEESATFYEGEADDQRRRVREIGVNRIQEDRLTEIQKIYGEAEIVSSLSFKDDRDNNVFMFHLSYQVHVERLSNKLLLEVESCAIEKYLDSNISPIRKSPYQLVQPYWVKEYIHIENPFHTWTPTEIELHHEHPSLLFTQSMIKSNQFIDYSIELKQLKDYVSKEDLKSYWMITKDIKRQAPGTIIIPD